MLYAFMLLSRLYMSTVLVKALAPTFILAFFTSTPAVLLCCTYARHLCIDGHGGNFGIQDSFL